MKIDVHNHFYPMRYLEELAKGSRCATITRDDQGRMLVNYAGDYNVVDPSHVDPEARIEAMDEAGIDMQIISLTTPGVHLEERERAIEISRVVNDAMAELVRKYPTRFRAFATLPMQDPNASVAEFERAIKELGLVGTQMFTSVGERTVDSRDYWPLYELAQELDAPIFIHPTSPPGTEAMADYRLAALVGFCMDTTLAASRLVFSGVLEQFPTVKFILSHLGGAVPYLAERVERGWLAFPECKSNISKSPVEYFKMMYLDTVNFDANALMCGLGFAGPDKLILGSDHPHQIGGIRRCAPAIQALPVSEQIKEKIIGGNARTMFRI